MYFGNETMNCRIVVIGDTLVGKTCLMNRLVQNKFNNDEQPTVGATHQMTLRDVKGYRLNVQIWDTAGQEKFRALGPIYFRDSHGAIIVYDQTKLETFENIKNWINSYIKTAGENTIIAIAANKSDLEENMKVPFEMAERWANQNGYLIKKTSAKLGFGIEELFNEMSEKIVKNRERNKGNIDQNISLNTQQNHQNNCNC